MASEWRDNNSRHSHPNTPTIGPNGRRDVIPASAILVVGDDNGAIFPGLAVLHGLHQIGDVLLPGHFHGITGMLVVESSRLDERDGG